MQLQVLCQDESAVDNRVGKNTRVYLGSAELAAVCAKLGRIPTVEEYMSVVPAAINGKENDTYKFNENRLCVCKAFLACRLAAP